jgi:hypothetical protein
MLEHIEHDGGTLLTLAITARGGKLSCRELLIADGQKQLTGSRTSGLALGDFFGEGGKPFLKKATVEGGVMLENFDPRRSAEILSTNAGFARIIMTFPSLRTTVDSGPPVNPSPL